MTPEAIPVCAWSIQTTTKTTRLETKMFDKHTHRAFAVLVSGRRTAIGVQDKQFGAKWDTVFDFAVEIARLFATNSERFDAESWFEQCGFGKLPVQRGVNRVGQLTKADVTAARAAINRPVSNG